MAVITLPATLKLGARGGMGQRRFDLLSQSEASGTQQTRLLGPPRWTLQLVQPQVLTLTEAGAWTALLMQLRGRVNVLAAWEPTRAAPQGTARGTLVLNAAAAIGAGPVTPLSVGGCSPTTGTFKAGDLLQVGTGLGTSQLVMVLADAAAVAGVATLYTEPPLRTAFAVSTPVAWDKPLAHYRLQADASTWTYAPGSLVSGMVLDLLEVWS